MESRFYQKFGAIAANKEKNNLTFDRIEYAQQIDLVKNSKGKFKNKTPADYQRLLHYDIKNVNGRQYLSHVKTGTLLFVWTKFLILFIQLICPSVTWVEQGWQKK